MERNLAIELIDFLYDSPSACHGVKATQRILNENGFIEIKEEDKWDLKSNGKYRLVSIPQVKATISGESFATREDGVEVANVEVEFSIIPLDNGVWRLRCDEDATGVDSSFASTFLTKFPTSAPEVSRIKEAKIA